jgi:hypothetical protein
MYADIGSQIPVTKITAQPPGHPDSLTPHHSGRNAASVRLAVPNHGVADSENIGNKKTFLRDPEGSFFLGGGGLRPLVPLLLLNPPFF